MISRSLFGMRLKNQRIKLKLSQEEAAEKTGIKRETWGKYERGIFMPGGDVLISFLKIGINVSELFAPSNNKETANKSVLREPVAIYNSTYLNQPLDKDEEELLNYFRSASTNGKFVILSVARTAEKKTDIETRKVA